MIGSVIGALLRWYIGNDLIANILGTAILGFILGIIFCLNIDTIQIFLENLFGTKLFSPEIYFLSSLPSRIDYTEVLFICILSIFLTFISTIYPSLKSAKIDPIKVIRDE